MQNWKVIEFYFRAFKVMEKAQITLKVMESHAISKIMEKTVKCIFYSKNANKAIMT